MPLAFDKRERDERIAHPLDGDSGLEPCPECGSPTKPRPDLGPLYRNCTSPYCGMLLMSHADDAMPSNTRYPEEWNDEFRGASVKEANQFVKERGGKWVVIKHSDGSVISTHDSKEKAEASFKAMMMHKGKVAGEGASYPPGVAPSQVSPLPPQNASPQVQKAQVYNPEINADLMGEGEHSAVGEALMKAQQQGATPEQAREQAMQVKNQVQQRGLNGQQTQNFYQLAGADSNPVGEILKSNFDGFVPQTVVQAAVKSLA